jgi:D-inositol-3-phosphate glycosyltransferase
MAPGQAAAAFGVPAGRPVIAAIGRTDPVKGLDPLIDALGPLRDRALPVAIVVPFDWPTPLP